MRRHRRSGPGARPVGALAVVLALAVGAPPAAAFGPDQGATAVPTARSAAPPRAIQASPDGCPTPDPTLRDLAAERGLSIGTAYRPAYAQDDPCYEAAAVATFDSLTPELATFTNAIAATPGRFDLTAADVVCDLAEAHDLGCQTHALVWDPVDHPEWGIVPAWIHDLPPAERRSTMIDLITAVGQHFRGRVTHTTVANEVFDASGALQPTVWNTTDDDSYLFDAFRAARRADPDAELLYNDFGAEDVNPKSDAILDLATRLGAETVSVEVDGEQQDLPLIDGVGFQAHVGTGPGQAPDPASVTENLARFGAAGLSVRLTELDVRVPVVDGAVAEADTVRQRELARDLVAVCVAEPACDGVTLWGFTDAHSWITENAATFTGEGAAHPFDAAYAPKPIWAGMAEALAPAGGSEVEGGDGGEDGETAGPAAAPGTVAPGGVAQGQPADDGPGRLALVGIGGLAVAALAVGLGLRGRWPRRSSP